MRSAYFREAWKASPSESARSMAEGGPRIPGSRLTHVHAKLYGEERVFGPIPAFIKTDFLTALEGLKLPD